MSKQIVVSRTGTVGVIIIPIDILQSELDKIQNYNSRVINGRPNK